jgi:hypothetical protein
MNRKLILFAISAFFLFFWTRFWYQLWWVRANNQNVKGIKEAWVK